MMSGLILNSFAQFMQHNVRSEPSLASSNQPVSKEVLTATVAEGNVGKRR